MCELWTVHSSDLGDEQQRVIWAYTSLSAVSSCPRLCGTPPKWAAQL